VVTARLQRHGRAGTKRDGVKVMCLRNAILDDSLL
jgi:hypothetical protein